MKDMTEVAVLGPREAQCQVANRDFIGRRVLYDLRAQIGAMDGP